MSWLIKDSSNSCPCKKINVCFHTDNESNICKKENCPIKIKESDINE